MRAEVPPPASKILGMAEVYDTEVTRVLPFPHTVPNFAGLAAAPAAGGSHKEKEKAGKEKEKEKERDKEKDKEKQPSYPTTTGTRLPLPLPLPLPDSNDCEWWRTARVGMRARAVKVTIPNVEKLRAHFVAEGRVAETVALRIIKEVTEMLTAEPTVLDLDAPLTGTCFSRSRSCSLCAHIMFTVRAQCAATCTASSSTC